MPFYLPFFLPAEGTLSSVLSRTIRKTIEMQTYSGQSPSYHYFMAAVNKEYDWAL
jgi:hypothetical protein